MSEDFNLDQVMQESSERNDSVEELATKDELTQTDFSSDAKELHDKVESILKDHNDCSCVTNIELVYNLPKINNIKSTVLKELQKAHENFMKAKYELYKVRSEFYTKENRERCKELTGKDTDGVFREFFKQLHLDLMEAREVAEFEYEQVKRVYESL